MGSVACLLPSPPTPTSNSTLPSASIRWAIGESLCGIWLCGASPPPRATEGKSGEPTACPTPSLLAE
eukprot:scaffold575798_cov18-Prasinocladus_malaysianus.AAC.1